jgi:hypothetical protein
MLHPVQRRAREPARRSQCHNQLKQIVLGLHTYHDVYGCFPPAYVPGPDGKPWHSWRVLILPFIEQQSLYEQYDFGEPWDGPNNSKLAGRKPDIYNCPSDRDSHGSAVTNYVAVVGAKAAWAGREPLDFGDFPDGTSSTIIVVEVADSGIHWMEPRDLSFEEARRGINAPGRARLSSHHALDHGYFYHDEPGVDVAMVDGSVRFLADWLDQPTLEAMLTIDGTEQIDLDAIPESRPRRYWSRIFAPIVLVVSYLILLLRPRRRGEAEARNSAVRGSPDPASSRP